MPWDGLGQRRATRNAMTRKPITTGMTRRARFQATDENGEQRTIWADDMQQALAYCNERCWALVGENTDEITVTDHPPAKDRSTPF